VPWIHVDDLVGLIRAALRDERFEGAVNAVAPHPVRNHELARTLARVVHRPALLPVPSLPLKLALGDLAGELLGSRRAVPRRALDLGFRFEYAELGHALEVELT
jgi:NAD dependent epimerase/dehydratase family enzyme